MAAAVGVLLTGALAAPGAGATEAETPAPDYEPTAESVETHPLPQWFEDDKFGIFIHWGAYSVPAWGPRGSYAEWYGQYMQNEGWPTYAYHRDTYGEDYDYDRFLDEWKAESFDPHAWVDLFEDAGAKYFVLTSKHHEGVALWDTATGTRDTVDRGPGRDLAGELFAAAREDSDLKAGFYYSLYEWNNPNYTGQQPRNPYTGETIPYTGIDPVDSYVQDYMHPQVEELVEQYDPDILWCDGQWDQSAAYWDMAPVIADYYNQAKNREVPKEVVVANRCKTQTGNLDSPELDFQTPEYTVKEDIDPVKWESSRGIAHSYGYNQNEPEEDYLTSDELVDSLADIVSKNGNLLLDIGPRADGTIPELQEERLRDIGAWLDVNGEAIYGTTYYNHAEDQVADVPVRYTMKDGTLYAIALEWPDGDLALEAGLPFSEDTTVRLLGADEQPLGWTRDEDGTVRISTGTDPGVTTSEHAYAFAIETPGTDTLLRTSLDVDELVPGASVDTTLSVDNPTAADLEDVSVRVDGPQGWTVTPATSDVGALGARERASVPLRVTVPQDAPTGRHALSVSVTVGGTTTTTSLPVDVNLPNLALGKTARQSSTYPVEGGNSYGPEKAVDGNTVGNGTNLANTAPVPGKAWWEVDLGEELALSDISVWNRTDCCTDRVKDYTIAVSSAPFPDRALTTEDLAAEGVWSTTVAEQAGRPSTTALGATGRHVRIQLAADGVELNLSEVEVRGGPAGGSPTVEVTAEARCLAGRAYVAVRALNVTDVPVDVRLETAFGSKELTAVAPGDSAYQSFATRASAVEAGSATVTATREDGGPTTVVADFSALACG